MNLSTSSIGTPSSTLNVVHPDYVSRPRWVRQWPFPAFDENPINEAPTAVGVRGQSVTGIQPIGKGKHTDLSSSDDDEETVLNPAALEQKNKVNNRTTLPCSRTTIHPLASEWTTGVVRTPDYRGHLREICTAAEAFVPKRAKADSSSFLDILLPDWLEESQSATAPSRPLSALPTNKPAVSIDEISTLISVACGQQTDDSGLLGGSATLADVRLQHMELSRMGKREGLSKRVHPPAVMLTLNNLPTKFLYHAPSDTLINSPRSSIVLLRNGVSVRELLPSKAIVQAMHAHNAEHDAMNKNDHSPSGRRSVAEQALHRETVKAVAALHSLERKKEVKRARLFGRMLSEYHTTCDRVTLQDIVSFSNEYDISRPSSALRVNLPPNLAPRHTKSEARLLPEEVVAARFEEQFSKHVEFQSRVKKIRSEQTQRIKKHQALTLARLESKQDQVDKTLSRRKRVLHERVEAARVNESLRFDDLNRVRAKSAFNALVKLEATVRRTDEAGSLGRARSAMRKRYNDELVRSVHPM